MIDDNTGSGSPPSWKPVPDPTVLTTEALTRESTALRRELDWQNAYFKQEIDLLRETYTVKIDGVISTADERFRRIQDQFDTVERQRIEQKNDTKAAVDAAFSAAESAVHEQTVASERAIAKSEAATAKQADQLAITFTTAVASVNQVISDVKDRLARIENQRIGGRESVTDQRESRQAVYAAAGFVLAVLLIIGAIAAFVVGNG